MHYLCTNLCFHVIAKEYAHFMVPIPLYQIYQSFNINKRNGVKPYTSYYSSNGQRRFK